MSITKIRIGIPFNTEAVVEQLPAKDVSSLKYFELDETEDGLFFRYEDVTEKTAVYGLGEQVRGINKKGWIYGTDCTDDPDHDESRKSLYGAHNFIIIDDPDRAIRFGVFFDYPGKVTYDLGYTDSTELKISVSDKNIDIYIIDTDKLINIVSDFRHLIGKSYLPPMWGLGYGQSRWGYKNEADILEVVKKYKDAGIPLDMIYLDIDYMERYKDFTLNEEAFPDLEKLSDDLKAQGIRLIPIIDAAVKVEDGYDVYEEGVQKGYFCTDKDGKPFVGAVWPGKSCFPDFLQPKVRDWFGKKYKFLIEKGIEGFWNDMNEPAIFYSENRLKQVIERTIELSKTNIGLEEFFELTGMYATLNGNKQYYEDFFHNVDGKPVRHDKVHNLFGMNMTRAAGEAIKEMYPDREFLFFSRASSIGAHRYGGIWMGDNSSWWSHILLNLQMLPSLNMCGYLFTGADIGGFGQNTTEDLVLRWIALGVFVPLFRNHSCMGTREQELYRFNSISTFRNFITIRKAMIPYMYELLRSSNEEGRMMYIPLAFAYEDDERARSVEDQLMMGDDIMLAPVYTQNAKGRYVYLPEDMLCVRMKSVDEYLIYELPRGSHYVECALDEIIFFVRSEETIDRMLGKA